MWEELEHDRIQYIVESERLESEYFAMNLKYETGILDENHYLKFLKVHEEEVIALNTKLKDLKERYINYGR